MMEENSKKAKYKLKTYKLDYDKFSGAAHIFSFDTFNNKTSRKGNKFDVEALRESLPKLGFYTTLHKNLKLRDCEDKLDEIAASDNKQFGSLLIIFLSHGTYDEVYTSDKRGLPIKTIMDSFNGTYINADETLKYKPKIFLFQTCRGGDSSKESGDEDSEKSSHEVDNEGNRDDSSDESGDDQIDEEEEDFRFSMPIGSNIFTGFASSPRFVCYRKRSKGSRFIQTLTTIINDWVTSEDENDKIDLLSLMTTVAAEVAKMTGKNWPNDLESKTTQKTPLSNTQKENEVEEILPSSSQVRKKRKNKIKKQMPWFSSTLTKKLEFRKFPNRNALYNDAQSAADSAKNGAPQICVTTPEGDGTGSSDEQSVI